MTASHHNLLCLICWISICSQLVAGKAEVNEGIDWETGKEFWSFKVPVSHDPEIEDPHGWIRSKVDIFVLQKLQETGLTPNGVASVKDLAIRTAMDLTGLPPESSAIDLLSSASLDVSFPRYIDHLLGSPAFGEHWAKLWLDVSRYAEDQAHIVGNNKALFYPNAYLYRDWVIEALNRDLPYDQFIKYQLAADLIEPEDVSNHPALGFIGLGPKYYNRNNPQVKADEWEDRVDIVTRGLMGMTVACARCHDHKYDPVSIEDFYALAGVFAGTEMYNRPLKTNFEKVKSGQAKNPEQSLHIIRETKPTNLKVHLRGDATSLGEEVHRGFLTVLGDSSRREFTEGSGRLELANEIATSSNPLTARVFVNRVWYHIMGSPLVDTPSNFGILGSPPSHPKLLDDLAVRFMKNEWSVKWLVREIVTSSTYMQSSQLNKEGLETDPDNKNYWRMNRKRLSIEAWRDRLLSIVGTITPEIGGESFVPSDPNSNRRTLYARISRLQLDPMLARFDHPDPNLHSPKRSETTTPLQKLFSINHPLMLRLADSLAEQLQELDNDTIEARVTWLYERLYLRAPAPEELTLAKNFLSNKAMKEEDLWTQFLQALLASNELLYLD